MFIALLVVIAVLFVAARLTIPRYGESVAGGVNRIDGKVQLADCPDSPNCVSSTATDTSKQIDPIAYTRAESEVVPALVDWLGQQPRVEVVRSTDDYLHATFRTALMGFTDDVELLRQTDGFLQVRSASRLGKSDLGANRKRVESLRESLVGVI